MNEPKVGEYWYVKVGSFNAIKQKILGVSNTHIISKVFLGGTYYETKANFIAKWEPNWFWKLLGYK